MEELGPDCAETVDLLRRIQAGDVEAFAQLFARYRPELRRFVALRLDPQLRARVDPSDAVQETQLEVCRRLADYVKRQPMPFRLWLRETAYERLLMLRRQHVTAARRGVGREVAQPDGSALLLARHLLAAGSSPSQQLHRRELVQRVRQAVAKLAEGDRTGRRITSLGGHDERLRGRHPFYAVARKTRYARAQGDVGASEKSRGRAGLPVKEQRPVMPPGMSPGYLRHGCWPRGHWQLPGAFRG
jgi:RNA polymerase sigma-70 factor (ECF subfamily)